MCVAVMPNKDINKINNSRCVRDRHDKDIDVQQVVAALRSNLPNKAFFKQQKQKIVNKDVRG